MISSWKNIHTGFSTVEAFSIKIKFPCGGERNPDILLPAAGEFITSILISLSV